MSGSLHHLSRVLPRSAAVPGWEGWGQALATHGVLGKNRVWKGKGRAIEGGTVGIGFGVRLLLSNTGSAICCLKIWRVDELLLGICFPTSQMEQAYCV